MTSVWPALWPPWKRTTISARSDSQSTILPLPSSPHCEPTTVTFDIILYLFHFFRGTADQHMRAAQACGLGRCVALLKPHQRDPAGRMPLLHFGCGGTKRQEQALGHF